MSDFERFYQQAKLGKNDWWRYLLGFFLILSSWVFIGSSIFVALQMYLIKEYANVAPEQLINLALHKHEMICFSSFSLEAEG